MVFPLVARKYISRPAQHDQLMDDNSLLQLETKQGIYLLHPGNHSAKTELDQTTLDEVDAVVVEDTFSEYESLSLTDFYRFEQYHDLLTDLLSRDVPAYVLDLPSELDREAFEQDRKFLKLAVIVYPALFLLGLSLLFIHPLLAVVPFFLVLPGVLMIFDSLVDTLVSLGFLSQHVLQCRLLRIRALMLTAMFYTSAGGRSALVAHKLETYVVPELCSSSDGQSKPIILIDYGAYHLDIYCYLKFDWLCRFTLSMFAFRNYSSKNDDYVDKVLEFTSSGSGVVMLEEVDKLDIVYKRKVHDIDG